MNSRRLMFMPPRGSDNRIVATFTRAQKGADVRFGSKADMCSAIGDVRYTPNSDRKSGHTLAAGQRRQRVGVISRHASLEHPA
jgi:hypothetical protein